jgi:hypothetical protein
MNNSQLADDLLAARRTKIPPISFPDKAEIAPPHRAAINTVVNDIVDDICKEIAELRHALDDIEQRIMESAAGAKHHLSEHAGICASFKGEVARIRQAIESIKLPE